MEGERVVEGLEISWNYFEPLKTVKVNIGTSEIPKIVFIWEYWDEKLVCKITHLLDEYEELFPTKFIEMKGIAGDLGEMRIPLKPDAKPVRQRPYRLTPCCKEKVQLEIKKMLDVGGHEAYTFTDGFSGYHQIRISKEDRHKTTFVMENGCY